MSQDEFLEWCQFQDTNYELVDGVPVAIVRARRAHDRAVVNAIRSLGNQLDGNPCQPFTDDSAVRIPNGNTRRPDVGVDCGQFAPDALAVGSPRLVLEVLSPTTRTEMEPLVERLHVACHAGLRDGVGSSLVAKSPGSARRQ